MEYVLEAHALTKSYQKNQVLNGVTMRIMKGDIYGFVGENGSGKTTVIRLICGLIHADEGEFSLFGTRNDDANIREARARIGAIVEAPSIYMNMSARDNLKMQCGILGIKDDEKCKEILTKVGLSDLWESKKHAGDFSLGMRQRLGIAMALLGNPEFIILDEPMNGLDPSGIVEIRELILRLNRESGITFLISSHILTELALVATRYGIIRKGEIIKEITAQELEQVCTHTTTIKSTDNEALYAFLAPLYDEALTMTEGGVCIVGDVDLNDLLNKIITSGIQLTAVNTHHSSIEDYYLSLVGGGSHA